MEFSNNPTAIISGASRGLGLALARALAERSWQLIIDARGEAALPSTNAKFEKSARVWAVLGDISDPHHRQQLAAAAVEAGGVNLVVNNASILGPSPQPALLAYPLGTLIDLYKTNVLALLGLLKAVQSQIKPGGCIITSPAMPVLKPMKVGEDMALAKLRSNSSVLFWL